MGLKPKYQKGEKLLCYHGQLLYEAKCLKVEIKDGKTIHYFIHYSGWNKSWDEWVPESRIVRFNEEGLQKRDELLKTHDIKKGGNSRSRKQKEKAPETKEKKVEPAEEKVVTETSRKRRTVTIVPEVSKDAKKKKTEIKVKKKPIKKEEAGKFHISLPDNLKATLAEEYRMIVEQSKLGKLPAVKSIDDIFSVYLNHKENITDEKTFDKLKEVTEGLKEYFESLLPTHLLYQQERKQHEELISSNPNVKLTRLYSIAHFLRLFVNFGDFLPSESYNDENVKKLKTYVEDLLDYLNKEDSLTSF